MTIIKLKLEKKMIGTMDLSAFGKEMFQKETKRRQDCRNENLEEV